MFRTKAVVLFLMLFPMLSYAQKEEKDSLEFKAALEQGLFTTFDSVDFRPVTYTHLYRPLGRPRLPLARASNIGLALHSYQALPQRWSLHYLQGGYLPMIYTADSMRYFDVSRPVTVLNYENGAKREQYFSVFHSQNLGEGLNIAFEYERITSDGFFIRQLTNHTRFYSTYNLKSRNNRFKSRGYFAISHLEAQESGGVFIDSVNQETNNPALLGINLFNAQSRSRGRVLGSHNSYELFKLGKDSLSKGISAFYEVNWNRSWRNYEDNLDPNDLFYDNIFLDSTNTADTSKSEVLRHSFGFQLADDLLIGYSLSEFNYYQNAFIDTSFESQHLMVQWQDSLFDHFLRLNFKKGISGYQEEDLMLNAKVFGSFKSFHYGVHFDLENHVVDYFTLKSRTNHHFFENNFQPTSNLGLGFTLHEDRTDVGLRLQFRDLGNLIYFDKDAVLKQHSTNIQVISLALTKEFTFFKNFKFMNKIYAQSISNTDLLPLPSFFSYHSLYYDNFFFKQSLRMQIGMDLFVISQYDGYAFSPEQGQFYLNPSEQTLGNIQQLDLFINFGITANGRIFFKMENVLEPTYSQASERIYQYPNPGRVFKFGFSWKMIN